MKIQNMKIDRDISFGIRNFLERCFANAPDILNFVRDENNYRFTNNMGDLVYREDKDTRCNYYINHMGGIEISGPEIILNSDMISYEWSSEKLYQEWNKMNQQINSIPSFVLKISEVELITKVSICHGICLFYVNRDDDIIDLSRIYVNVLSNTVSWWGDVPPEEIVQYLKNGKKIF